MIMEIYAVKDKQVNAFLQPFFSPTLGSAMRSLKVVINDPNHDFSRNSDDFTLYRLGNFDDSTGLFSVETEPERILPLSQLKDLPQ